MSCERKSPYDDYDAHQVSRMADDGSPFGEPLIVESVKDTQNPKKSSSVVSKINGEETAGALGKYQTQIEDR